MDTPSPAWLPLLTSLTIELTLVVAVALAIRPALKSALGRRALWQVTLVSLALITLVEVSGVGRSAWTGVADRLEENQTVAADVRRRTSTIESPDRLLTSAATPPLQERIEAVAAPVAVRVAPAVVAESVVGWPGMLWLAGFALLALRVTVVRALDFQERFSRTQQEAMLAHELAHLAARDPAWHLVADLVAALLWWHPLAWWSRRQLRSACETAAAEASLLVENGPHALAECLVTLGGRLARTHSFGGLGIEGDDYRSGLGRRVKRLLDLNGQSWRPWRRSRGWLMTSFCPVALVLLVLAGTSWVKPREAKAKTPGQSFEISVLGLAWSSILQITSKASGPGAAGNGSVEPERIDWKPWSQAAVAQARAEGRPVLVHFTADWCVTAQLNEKTSLDIPSVREKLRTLGAVALRADYTRPDDAIAAELRSYNRVSVPLVLLFSWDAGVPPQVLPEVLTPDLVLRALDQTLPTPSGPEDPSRRADTTRKNDASTLILQGKTLLDAGKLAEAEARLKEALRLDPAHKAAAHYLALADAQLGKATAPKAAGVPLVSEWPVVGELFVTNAPPNAPSIQGAAASSSVQSNSEPLFTRWFKVDPNTLANNLREMIGTNAVLSKSASIQELTLTNLRHFLAATGVELSPPKTIFLNDRSGVLMVRATLSELDAIEQLIQVLNTSPHQVTLEVRFCEITEEDGKKLGFDWLLGNASGIYGSNIVASVMAPSPGVAPWDSRVTSGRRPGASEPASATVTGILTEPQFGVVLRAMEHRRGMNLMTAPKVTTLSGRQAQIKTVEIRYIVTDLDFNTNAGPASGGSAEAIGIQPIAQPFELGPVIDLAPTVAADGFTIHLTVTATVKEFVGYDLKKEFLATLRNGHSELGSSPTPLPVFRLRQVVTSAVVWDGQTLVLSGGSMAFEDVGEKSAPGVSGQKGATRLLRPNPANRQRKSLLVFVTPTIIDPAGNRVHSPEELPIRKSSVPPQKPATMK